MTWLSPIFTWLGIAAAMVLVGHLVGRRLRTLDEQAKQRLQTWQRWDERERMPSDEGDGK